MNTSPGSYLASIFLPARCDGASGSVSAFLKCLTESGLNGTGLRGIAERNLTVRQASAVGELTSHLCSDIGMTQGQYMAAQLGPVLDARKSRADSKKGSQDSI